MIAEMVGELRGPVYEIDDRVDTRLFPMPWLKVFVLGVTGSMEERLVEYGSLGTDPAGIWYTRSELISQ